MLHIVTHRKARDAVRLLVPFDTVVRRRRQHHDIPHHPPHINHIGGRGEPPVLRVAPTAAHHRLLGIGAVLVLPLVEPQGKRQVCLVAGHRRKHRAAAGGPYGSPQVRFDGRDRRLDGHHPGRRGRKGDAGLLDPEEPGALPFEQRGDPPRVPGPGQDASHRPRHLGLPRGPRLGDARHRNSTCQKQSQQNPRQPSDPFHCHVEPKIRGCSSKDVEPGRIVSNFALIIYLFPLSCRTLRQNITPHSDTCDTIALVVTPFSPGGARFVHNRSDGAGDLG